MSEHAAIEFFSMLSDDPNAPAQWARDSDIGPWGKVHLGLGALAPDKHKRGGSRDITVREDLGIIPGISDVKVKRGRKSDKTPAHGAHGAVITPKGIELASVTIAVRIWTKDQFLRMIRLLDYIDPRIGPQANDKSIRLEDQQAYDIHHPALAMRKVRAIFIDSIDGPDLAADETLMFTINATQWVPIADKPKKLASTTASAGLSGVTVYDGRVEGGGNLGDVAKAPPGAAKPGQAR